MLHTDGVCVLGAGVMCVAAGGGGYVCVLGGGVGKGIKACRENTRGPKESLQP